jgi:HK97 family phage major capsid protein
MHKSARALREEIEAIYARADGRALTASERGQIEGIMEVFEETKRIEDRAAKLFGGTGKVFSGVADARANFAGGDDPGARFIASQGFKAISSAELRGKTWTSGPIDVGGPSLMMKGTLLEGSGAPGSGSGGGLVPVPQLVPGYVQQLTRPMYLEQLLDANTATTNTVRYITQGTATSGAAGVAEGGTKPESTLGYSTIDEPVRKVATSLVGSDEVLDDAPAVRVLINGELTRFVNLAVERQLLRGVAGGNEVQGLLTSRNVPVYTAGTAQGNIAEQLFKAANSMRGSAFLEPDWLLLHPTDYEKLRLLKDNSGQLYFGGPGSGSYGSGQSAGGSPLVTGMADLVWGKPCYVTPLIGAGTALVGTRAGACVWSRGGLVVESTNSHLGHFTSDLMAFGAERRLGLTVYRSNAYVEVRGLA